MHITNR